jgi:hypothetical protein
MLVGLMTVTVALVACEGKEAKLKKCHSKCEELNKEYLAKCTGPGADECKKKMNETLGTCKETCDKAMK